MGLIQDIKDWIANAICSVTRWIWSALSAAQAWTIGALNYITEEMRVWKYRFRTQVAEWLSNPVVFWLSIAGVVGLVIYAHKVAALFVHTKLYITVKSAMAFVDQVTGSFLLKTWYIQSLSVHKIFLIFSVDYQQFWGKLDEAFAGMAEEIQLGIGTLNVLMQSVRNLYYSTYAMFGYNSDMIETKFYIDVTEWTSKAQARWEKYVRNPQSIFTDIQNELIFPILEKQSLAGEGTAIALINTNNELQKLIESTDTVRKDINSLVTALPDEIEDAVRGHIGPALENMNAFYVDTLLPFMQKVDASISVLDETLSLAWEAMELNSKKPADFISMLRIALFGGDLDKPESRVMLNQLLLKIMNHDTETLTDMMLLKDMSRTMPKEDIRPTTEIAPFREPAPGRLIDLKSIVVPSGGWYIGEY